MKSKDLHTAESHLQVLFTFRTVRLAALWGHRTGHGGDYTGGSKRCPHCHQPPGGSDLPSGARLFPPFLQKGGPFWSAQMLLPSPLARSWAQGSRLRLLSFWSVDAHHPHFFSLLQFLANLFGQASQIYFKYRTKMCATKCYASTGSQLKLCQVLLQSIQRAQALSSSSRGDC